MRVAVTGANGFIASHVVSALLDDGHDVVACVRSATPEKTQHLIDLAEGKAGTLALESGCDMAVANAFDKAFEGADVVMHTAAVVEIGNGKGASKTISASIDGTKAIIDSVRKSGAKRLVFTSSIASIFSAYGKPDDHVYSEEDWNEYSTAELDAYGYGKTMAEKQVWECNGEMEVVTINPGVVLGPCMTKQHTKSSTSLVREIIYGNKMHAYRSCFVDVRDVARAHALAAASPDAVGKRFVMVNDTGPLVTTALAKVAQPLFPDIKLKGEAAFMYNPVVWWFFKLTGQANAYQVAAVEKDFAFSNAQAKNVLGMEFRKLEDTLKDTVSWGWG